MAAHTTAIGLKRDMGLCMTLNTIRNISMAGVMATAAAQVGMRAGVLRQFPSLRLMTFGTIRFKRAQVDHGRHRGMGVCMARQALQVI